MQSIVTLTTDFGLSDSYAAAMKAAILRHVPDVRLVDVTHLIPPGDVVAGSFTLERAIDAFPAGTIHLAVIDPGVGSTRKILVAQIAKQWIVCPDNGLVTWPWRRQGPGKAHELTWRPKHTSCTFHGRDIMGPAAGMLAAGKSIREIARPMRKPILLKIAPAKSSVRTGQIIHIDHFGNATTNIPRIALPRRATVRVGSRDLGKLRQTYADVESGESLALIGSADLLEIAVRDGSAAQLLSLRVGDKVQLRAVQDGTPLG